MALVFNAPPTWPTPPHDWHPPADWEPDPSWPAPPPGWELWQRANPHPFRRAFTGSDIPFAGGVVLALTSPAADELPVGEAIGRLLAVLLLIPGLIVGTAACLSARRWGWPRYTFAIVLAVFVPLVLSRASAA